MPVMVFITIDTEEDLWSEYRPEGNPVENISRLGDLQTIFDRYDAVPTYLIDWPVASSDDAVRTLLDIFERGGCEIGTHCHPWNTPPFEEVGDGRRSMLGAISGDLAGRKIERLHRTIVERFGITPVSFRAGRWSMGPAAARTIERLGYRIDSSVTPGIDWRRIGGVDYSRAPNSIYRFEPDEFPVPASGGRLVEVPATIGFLQAGRTVCGALWRGLDRAPFSRFHILGILDRMHILNFRWLSPETSSGGDCIRLARRKVASGRRYVNMVFHSNSLLPGVNPFVRDEGQRDELLNRIDKFCAYAVRSGYEFAPLSRVEEIAP